MIIETNPQEDDLGNDPDNNSDVDANNEANPEPGSEPDMGPGPEAGCEPGFVSELEHVPKGTELREELSRIWAVASELESIGFFFDPNDTYSRNRKLELQTRLSAELEKLHRYKVKLDKEEIRCRKNLDRIRSDSEKLNLEETRECYSEAEHQQQKQYHEALCDRDVVSRTLMKVQAALGSSQIGSFPIGNPQGQDQFPISFPGHVLIPPSQSQPGTLGDELDGLISLGKSQEQTDPKDIK
jgi:hypothetical protein